MATTLSLTSLSKSFLNLSLLTIGLALNIAPARAVTDTFLLVKDIWPGTASSHPNNFVASGQFTFFTATIGNSDNELYAYNTTTTVTTRVKDIRLGFFGSSPANLTNVNGTLFFTANDGTDIELWKSDGTEGGTTKIDINPGPNSSSPRHLTPMGSLLFLYAFKSGEGYELYVTDGTTTTQLTNQNGASDGVGFSTPPAVMNGILYFTGNTGSGATGPELWRSDGTIGGTYLVKDAIAGGSGSSPNNLIAVGTTLFFQANNGLDGYELWKSDGTEAGTMMLKDIYSGASSSFPSSMNVVGSTLYFLASDASGRTLWRSNGTEAGTVPAPNFSVPFTIDTQTFQHLTATSTGLVFIGDDGVNGKVLWRYDGVTTPQPCESASRRLIQPAIAQRPVAIGALAYAGGFHPDFGTEVASCSPATGVLTFFHHYDGPTSSTPLNLAAIAGNLYLSAPSINNGREPFFLDLSNKTYTQLADINTAIGQSNPSGFTTFGQYVYFFATSSLHGTSLWRSNATEVGTTLVANINAFTDGLDIRNMLVFNGYIYFAASDGRTGLELWRSDGTPAGTVRLTDINPTGDGFYTFTQNLTVYNGKIYFSGSTTFSNWEPFSYDPSTNTTTMVKEIFPGTTGSYPTYFTIMNGILYFAATNTSSNNELWRTDGTEIGTVMVKEIYPALTTGSNPFELTAIGNTLFFAATHPDYGYELWKSDGTEGGTVLVADLDTGIPGTGLYGLTEFNGQLFFTANLSSTPAGQYEPYKSDGTEAGTVPLKATNNPIMAIDSFTALDNILYFSGYTAANGYELWITDGTDSNTNQLIDIFPGINPDTLNANHGSPQQMQVLGNRLFFTANDGIHGRELWYSRPVLFGTAFSGYDINTTIDINGNPGWGSPLGYGDLNGVVLTSATDGILGRELYAFRAYYPIYLPQIKR